MSKYDREQVMLAILAASNGAEHTPVQIQKLLFLFDKKISGEIGGPFFNFIPYDYGPFDKDIYGVLFNLSSAKLVDIISLANSRWSKYRLTVQGQKEGESILKSFPNYVFEYITLLSDFVRSLSFEQLVSAIYNAYPEMKANSVFRE